MSLLKWSRFVAVFEDENGDQVGRKVFRRTIFGGLGHDNKRTFEYRRGSYIIDPESSRIDLKFNSQLFFDTYVYIYKIGNPLPISFKGGEYKPVMKPELLRERLRSKLVKDLNSVAMGGLQINWKILLLVAVGILVLYFVFTGQNPFIPHQEEVVKEVVNNASRVVAGGRG